MSLSRRVKRRVVVAGLVVASLAHAGLAAAGDRAPAAQLSLNDTLAKLLPHVRRVEACIRAPLRHTPKKPLLLPVLGSQAELVVKPETCAKVDANVQRMDDGRHKVTLSMTFEGDPLELPNGLELAMETPGALTLGQWVAAGVVRRFVPKRVRPAKINALSLETVVDANGQLGKWKLGCNATLGVVRRKIKGIELPQSAMSTDLVRTVVNRVMTGRVSGHVQVDPGGELCQSLFGGGDGELPSLKLCFNGGTKITAEQKGHLVLKSPAGAATVLVGKAKELTQRSATLQAPLSAPLNVEMSIEPGAVPLVSLKEPLEVEVKARGKLELANLLEKVATNGAARTLSLEQLRSGLRNVMVDGADLSLRTRFKGLDRPVEVTVKEGVATNSDLEEGTAMIFTQFMHRRGRQCDIGVMIPFPDERFSNALAKEKPAAKNGLPSLIAQVAGQLRENLRPYLAGPAQDLLQEAKLSGTMTLAPRGELQQMLDRAVGPGAMLQLTLDEKKPAQLIQRRRAIELCLDDARLKIWTPARK